ncbi:hypothetical protein CKALI_10750 [Corynebacterium kalinowskii]|uniref:Secreted protein n=1 Tax=Corynebacterium kalinowskii TaxID=2675216 RepID=A0A6B8W076_9CORY|nr:hypothetical protein [Corynebacterium kalinowskii]QGU03000.1 hypothetical protein CKALI_10750 [Corynebacterium kalinowskii]
MRKALVAAITAATLFSTAPAVSAAEQWDGTLHMSSEIKKDYQIAFANLSFEYGLMPAISAFFRIPFMPLSTWFRNETASPARPIAWD